jgi:8-oxo-dGTP pyrophosphatase MutT (NUDIX family)
VSAEERRRLSPTAEFSLVVVLSPNAHPHDDDRRGDLSGAGDLSILLGNKLRGFGKGFYNCFGGKLERSRGEHDHPAKGAVRELEEETGIAVPLYVMENGFVGVMNFTFEDGDVHGPMRIYLYCAFISLSQQCDDASPQNGDGNYLVHSEEQYYARHALVTVRSNQIRGCDEIEPKWFHRMDSIPLDQMFCDDSLWLTMLLNHYAACGNDPPPKLNFDAWFHFHPGGTDANSIMHYFIQIKDVPKKLTLERRLFHALHVNHIQSPSIKEFKENWSMANAVRTFMQDESRMEYVLDVAGGHGALGEFQHVFFLIAFECVEHPFTPLFSNHTKAALFLILVPTCHTAVVIDPAICTSGKNGVSKAWSSFWTTDNSHSDGNHVHAKVKKLQYRHECLRTGLRKELDWITQHAKGSNVTVVACHACQHLTDETLQIASEYGVNVAVMSCCQKDLDGWWKCLRNRLCGSGGTLSIGALMDLLAAGKMMGWDTGSGAGVRYQVKMKLMDDSISQQNRMILCKAVARDKYCITVGGRDEKTEFAHKRLTRAYIRAHKLHSKCSPSKTATSKPFCVTEYIRSWKSDWCICSLLVGVGLGSALSLLILLYN